MKHKLSYWSRSLVAALALTSQVSAAPELRMGQVSGSNIAFDSPLSLSRWTIAEDAFEAERQLPATLNTHESIVSPLSSSPAPQTVTPTSLTKLAFSTYHSRAPPVSI